MIRTRSSQSALQSAGVAGLLATFDALGLQARNATDPNSYDLIVTMPGGEELVVVVKASAIPTLGQLPHLLESTRSPAVVVADQLSQSLRDEIEQAGGGWLDRRGHMKFTAPGLWIDADVPAIPRRDLESARPDPIRGRAGLTAAAALLMHPDDPPGPSEVARHSGLAASSISRAMSSMADGHLVESIQRGRYRPLVPELFWALAEVWPREVTAVRWKDLVGKSDPLGLWRFDQDVGCALAGVRGAVGWGAPLASTADYPLHVYAPTEDLVRKARLLNEGGSGREVHFTVDPVSYVTASRFLHVDPQWWTAHPLFCAIDLAVAARDREALAEWDPPEGFTRVW